MKTTFPRLVSGLAILALILALVPAQFRTAAAVSVFINEIHYDNAGTDAGEAIEIAGPAGTDLSGWSLVLYNGSGGASYSTIALSGLIPDQGGGYGVVSYPAVGLQNGSPDGIALVGTGSMVVQFLSYEGTFTAVGGPANGMISTDIGVSEVGTEPVGLSLQLTGTGSTYEDFTWAAPAANTIGAINTGQSFGVVADSAPAVASTSPVEGNLAVPLASDIVVNFSEPVDLGASWFNLTCSLSGAVTAAATGGPTSFTINPDVNFQNNDACTLTVYASQVTDQDANDPPDTLAADFTLTFSAYEACAAPYTPVYDIQGTGLSAAITGNVATQGLVVGDFETTSGGIGGFYLQDQAGDGNTDSSDGIFVYTGSSNLVSAGQVVRVSGYARERFNQTTLNGSNSDSSPVAPGNIVICGSGSANPVDISLPFPSVDYLERFEGMLVRFPQALTISEYFNYDRFGEMVLALPLDGESRAFTPTAIDEPGADALARAAANSLSRITLDDGRGSSNPSVVRHPNGLPFSLSNRFRGGDLVQNTVGVIGYDFDLYRIQPTAPAEYTAANPRPAAPEPVGGSLQVAAMNTLNYFITLDYPTGNPLDNKCGPLQNVECRGADSDQPNELTRQRAKLLAALSGLDADIIGLNELENTTGVDPLGDPTWGIVTGLNGIYGPGTYAAIDTGVIGTDAIRVGLIYRPAVVSPVGSFQLLTSTIDPRFLDTKNRPSLAQTFEVLSTGARFTVVVNHLKSKGSDCLDVGDPDLGDGQGNCNLTRTNAAQALVDWLATDPTLSGDPDFLIMGDLNSYAKEDPIDAVLAGPDDSLGTADDYTNLILQYQGPYAYSYVFDGQAGYLDQALASAGLLSQVRGAADWHINADEPDLLDYDTSFKPNSQDALYEPNAYRSSDHDAVVVGLDLNDPADVNPISVSPNPVKISSLVTASATFIDQGDADPHTGLWDWGDGTTSAAVISESGGSGTASGTHAYTVPGLYTVTLTVTDYDGASTQVTYQYVVVYDPAAGFFVGSGWVNSPAGAFQPDPLLKGKAEFKFDIKYQKNGTLPAGSTTLQVGTGLYFQSTSYDWLVVNGSRAQFQGTGTLNGSAGYKFQVFAVDGSPDTFRMLIWYEDSIGQHMVYDSGPEQALGGGSIKYQPK